MESRIKDISSSWFGVLERRFNPVVARETLLKQVAGHAEVQACVVLGTEVESGVHIFVEGGTHEQRFIHS